MTTTVYRNGYNGTTASAPDLTNAAGDLIALLDFCLLPLGWTQDYSLGTNHVVYLQPPGTTEFWLEVDDTNAAYAVVQGWTNSGRTEPFPLSPLPAYWPKAPSATPVPWVLVTDGGLFHLGVQVDGSNGFGLCSFGTFPSYLPTDAYNCLLTGNIGTTWPDTANEWIGPTTGIRTIARDYTQSITLDSVNASIADAVRADATAAYGTTGTAYPSAIETALLVSPILLRENTYDVRGKIPGLWVPLHGSGFYGVHTDYFTAGSGSPVAGKTFEVWSYGGVFAVYLETSDWT